MLARAFAAAAGGALLYASFPPRTLWWLAPIAFALLVAATHERRARAGFGLGVLFGLGFLLPLLVWTGEFVGDAPWLILAAFESLPIGLAGLAMAVLSRLPRLARDVPAARWLARPVVAAAVAPVLLAAAWVAGEALRARVPFGGFPWGRVAFGQPDGLLLPLAAVGGAPLLSFAVVVVGAGLAQAARGALARDRAVALAAVVAVLAPLGAALAATPLVGTDAQAGTLVIAQIQGNVPRAGLDFNAQRRAVLDNHRSRTEELARDVAAGRAPQPDLVLWPENAADIDPIRNDDARAAVDAAAAAIRAPILLGAILVPPDDGPFNGVVQWEPGRGPTDQYIKRHVQPFGEYIPLRRLARLVSSDVDRVRRDLLPGDEVGVFDVAGTRVAVVTCYEVAFDHIARDAVRAGGTVLDIPTNNATFGDTEMTYQQLAMSRVRAVEHGRAALVTATSGVSAVVAPDGSTPQRTGLFTAEALVANVPLRTTTTLATRLGAGPEWLIVAVTLGALAVVAVGTVRGRGRGGEHGAPAPPVERAQD